MTLTATEATLLFAVFLAALGWAGLITYEWWDTKQYNKRIVEINNREAEEHNMTKLLLQAEKQRHAVTTAKLAHVEKMLYGVERLRKDVMQ